MPLHPLAVEGPVGRRAQPEVPFEPFGQRLFSLGRFLAVGPAAAVPHVDLLDVAQRAVADQFQGPAKRAAVGALVAHGRGHLVLAGQLAQRPGLVDRARQRLLAEDVLAGLDGRGRDDGVRVVGRGDHDRVDHLVPSRRASCGSPRTSSGGSPRGAGTPRPAWRSQLCSEAA